MEAEPTKLRDTEVSPSHDPEYSWPFGENHKRSRWIIGVALALCVLVPVVMVLFEGDLESAVWHLRHGNEFVYDSVAYRVEFPRYAGCWNSTCTIKDGYGIFHTLFRKDRTMNWISFSLRGKEWTQQTNQRRASVLKWKLLGERTVNVAGVNMRCEDYLQSNNRFHTISCYSVDSAVLITSIGDGDPAKFYELLSTAKRK